MLGVLDGNGTQIIFWAESCMIRLLDGCLEQNEPQLPILLVLGHVRCAGAGVRPQGTFWAELCMNGLLGGCLEQNEPHLPILLLFRPVGCARMPSEQILG